MTQDPAAITVLKETLGERRAIVDLALGLVIALLVVLFTLAISYVEPIERQFASISGFSITDFFIYFLLFWLTLLLWMAFRRWQVAARTRQSLEAVISGISPNALLVVSPDRRIVMCNASVRRVFGYEPEEILHGTTDILYSDRRRNKQHVHEVYEALERDGFHIGTATGTKKDGERIPLEIISGDIPGQAGAVLLLRDISERLENEQRQRELENRVQEQQRIQSLGEFAGGIAHDFNNMLTALIGNADLALDDMPEGSRARENIEEILNTSREAADLCRNLLAYAGRGHVEVSDCDLSEAVREMESFVKTSISAAAEVNYRFADDLPTIKADVTQVRQIIINLVTNAAQALEDEPGTITIATGTRDCDEPLLASAMVTATNAPGRYAFLEVTDTGCGMTDDVLKKILDPLFTTRRAAHGLGLSSVAGTIRSHKGAMCVETERGKGSIFTVFFPMPSEAREEGPGPDPAAATTFVPMASVLVVEDEEPVQRFIERVLHRIGVKHVYTAADGAEGIEEFRRHADEISLVLLDMTMPRISGLEALGRIREIGPDVPVILMSGYSEETVEEDLDGQHVSGFIQKPFEPKTLTSAIRAVLAKE